MGYWKIFASNFIGIRFKQPLCHQQQHEFLVPRRHSTKSWGDCKRDVSSFDYFADDFLFRVGLQYGITVVELFWFFFQIIFHDLWVILLEFQHETWESEMSLTIKPLCYIVLPQIPFKVILTDPSKNWGTKGLFMAPNTSLCEKRI